MADPETRNGSNSSPTGPTSRRGSGSASAQQPEVEETMKPLLKCPRCDSPNTKFCYYNNYSLRQPRHFCKTCRRYWTHGGSLRNVPIGGASRKPNKNHLRSSPSPSSSGSHPDPAHHGLIGAGSCTTAITTTTTTTTASCGDHIHVAIESLSSINQEMHWKLQHQRLLSFIYDHHHHDELTNNQNNTLLQEQLGEVGPTEWFLDQTTSCVPGNYSGVTGSTEVDAADNPDGWRYLRHHQFNGSR